MVRLFDNPLRDGGNVVGHGFPISLTQSIIGALLGLFSAFMPQIASYFVPWGYFVPLCSYEVKVWDQASHTVLYGTRPYNWGLLVFTFGLAVSLFGVCWRVMCNKEV